MVGKLVSVVRILTDKGADLLDVATLDEPDMADTAIDKLVMDNGSKELLKAVAKTYTDNKERFSADFINGKGEGQIILLHGPPGTGKTLTAGKSGV
jgi:SpoVK/Ycf46/Vps4 family AAA+-type ATPase